MRILFLDNFVEDFWGFFFRLVEYLYLDYVGVII